MIRVLGRGKDNTTYLVRDKQRDIFLAMKTLSDGRSSPSQLNQEISLMMDFNHPGIPKIIEIIRGNELLVFQEYISGISLGDFLACSISLKQFLSVSEQLINIIYYLHHFEEEPVLYLDFKPEHIQICGTKLYLLDFGMATRCKKGKVKEVYYGTEEYSAPEVKRYHYGTVRSDIYSLGKIMETMMEQTIAKSYWEKMKMRKIKQVIRRCIYEEEELRFEDVNEIWSELQLAERRWRDRSLVNNLHFNSTIAVIGTHHGVGTTHIATGLTQCCNRCGKKGIYVEQTASQWLRQSSLSQNEGSQGDKKIKDLIQKNSFVGLPAYGPFYEPKLPKQGVFIRDLGVLWNGFLPELYEKVIIVLGSRFWEEEQTLEYIRRFRKEKNCIFVCSATAASRVHQLARLSGVQIHMWSYDEDIFHISREKIKLLNRMLGKETDA